MGILLQTLLELDKFKLVQFKQCLKKETHCSLDIVNTKQLLVQFKQCLKKGTHPSLDIV